MSYKPLIIIFAILGSSCSVLKDKKVDRSKERIKLVESSTVTEKAPGDNVTVYIPYPLPSPDRPKAQVKRYEGKKGATVDVEFDSIGVVRRIDADCPEVDKVAQHNRELEYRIKERQVESKANIDAINAIGKWTSFTIIPIGLFFAFAFWLKK